MTGANKAAMVNKDFLAEGVPNLTPLINIWLVSSITSKTTFNPLSTTVEISFRHTALPPFGGCEVTQAK